MSASRLELDGEVNTINRVFTTHIGFVTIADATPAVIADALASNRGLLERLRRGMHGPDMAHQEQYQVIFNGLYQTTREQIEALEVFARVDWSE